MSQNDHLNGQSCATCRFTTSQISSGALSGVEIDLNTTPFARLMAKDLLLNRGRCQHYEDGLRAGTTLRCDHIQMGVVSLSAQVAASNFMRFEGEQLIAVTRGRGGVDRLQVNAVTQAAPPDLPPRQTGPLVDAVTAQSLLSQALRDHPELDLIVVLESGAPAVWPDSIALGTPSTEHMHDDYTPVMYNLHRQPLSAQTTATGTETTDSAGGVEGLVVYKPAQPQHNNCAAGLEVDIIEVDSGGRSRPRQVVVVSYTLRSGEPDQTESTYIEYIGHIPCKDGESIKNLNGYLGKVMDAGKRCIEEKMERVGKTSQSMVHLAFHGDTNCSKTRIKNPPTSVRDLNLTLGEVGEGHVLLPTLWGGFVTSGEHLHAYVCDSGACSREHKFYMSSIELLPAGDSDGQTQRDVAFPSVASAISGSVSLSPTPEGGSGRCGYAYTFDHVSMITHSVRRPCATHFMSTRSGRPAYSDARERRASKVRCAGRPEDLQFIIGI